MGPSRFRERVREIAERKRYKRLAQAAEEAPLETLVSEIDRYSARDEIVQHAFGGSFFCGELVRAMKRFGEGGAFANCIFEAAAEIMDSTEDDTLYRDVSAIANTYGDAFCTAMSAVECIAHYSRDSGAVKKAVNFMREHMRAMQVLIRQLCSFNYADSQKVEIARGSKGVCFASPEEVAGAMKASIDTYVQALGRYKEHAYSTAYAERKPWYSRAADFLLGRKRKEVNA